MGMITRVRGRVRANSFGVDKERTAQSVCLLSAILLLPYCPRGPLPLLPAPAPALYSFLVLPVVLSANYRYPVGTLKTLIETTIVVAKHTWNPLCRSLLRIYGPIDRAENLFLKMKNLSIMVNQLVFFIIADKVLVPPQQHMTCLYTLMFYNVIAYCMGYIKELIEKEDWTPYVTITERSRIKHLAMSATKIVLEWTKAVTFAITVTFMLLVFGLEQGLQNYKPSIMYTTITWLYYSATEKIFVDMFLPILNYFQIEALENLEYFYSPVILRCLTISMSMIFTLILVPISPWKFIIIAGYLNIWIRTKELINFHGAALIAERKILNKYRNATDEEIDKFDDVCAVCLFGMIKARITPCHHLFHAECLRQCLKTSDKCPMCKRELKFD